MDENTFNTVWKESIRPALVDTGVERKHARKQRIAGITAFAAIGGIFIVALLAGDISFSKVENWTIIFWAVGLFVLILAGAFYRRYENDFQDHFKQAAVSGVSEALTDFTWSINDSRAEQALSDVSEKLPESTGNHHSSPLFTNDGDEHPKQLLRASGLYDSFDICRGQDLIFGESEGVSVVAQQMYVTKNVGSEMINLFGGFLIRIGLSTTFRGETYVQTEADGEFLGTNIRPVGAHSQAEETELEWHDFEEFLLVKSTDPQEAREIFTPDFMQELYDWWQNHKEPMRISFKIKQFILPILQRID